jgi:hypothetical protein
MPSPATTATLRPIMMRSLLRDAELAYSEAMRRLTGCNGAGRVDMASAVLDRAAEILWSIAAQLDDLEYPGQAYAVESRASTLAQCSARLRGTDVA